MWHAIYRYEGETKNGNHFAFKVSVNEVDKENFSVAIADPFLRGREAILFVPRSELKALIAALQRIEEAK